MRRILVVSPYIPVPAAGGGGTSYYYYLQGLAQHFEVDFVCQSKPGEHTAEDLRELQRFCARVEVVKPDKLRSYMNCLVALGEGGSLRVAYAGSSVMRGLVRRLARERCYFCAIASHGRMAQYLDGLSIPVKILDFHDIVSFRHRLLMKYSRNPISWLVNFVEFLRIRQFEASQVERFTQTWVCTGEELKKIRHITGRGDIRVARKGIKVDDFRSIPRSVDDWAVMFSGQMSYGPNEDGARFLLNEILPFVHRRLPGVKCWFVGANPPGWLVARGRGDPSVEVTGRVETMVPYLRKAAVFLCPLRVGTGIRIKLLEAMAAECPIVTTSVGYRGIEAVPGRHIIVADTAQDFAEAVIALLSSPEQAQALAREAYRFVRNNYDLEVISQEVAALVWEPVSTFLR